MEERSARGRPGSRAWRHPPLPAGRRRRRDSGAGPGRLLAGRRAGRAGRRGGFGLPPPAARGGPAGGGGSPAPAKPLAKLSDIKVGEAISATGPDGGDIVIVRPT